MLSDKLLDSADVVVMNAIPGAESLQNPGHAKLFHLHASDKQQIEKIVDHARTIDITRLSMLARIYRWVRLGRQRQEAGRLTGLAFKSVKSTTDAKVLVAAGVEWQHKIRKASINQPIFVLSYVQPALLMKVAGLNGARGVGKAQTYPNPIGRTLPQIRDFQTAMRTAHPSITEYTPFHSEGYLSARSVDKALSAARTKTLPEAAWPAA